MKKLIILCVISFIGGVVAGKMIIKPEVKETIVYKESTSKEIQEDKNIQKDKEIVIREILKKDGTSIKTTHIVDKGKIDISKKEIEVKTVEVEKKIELRPTWAVSLMFEPSFNPLTVSPTGFGIAIERRIIGSVYLGAFGSLNGRVGVMGGIIW